MTIFEYLKEINFDTFKLYYREYKYSDYVFFDFANTSELLNQNQKIENSIINDDGLINSTFTHVTTSSHKGEVLMLCNQPDDIMFPYRKNSVFNIALILEYGKKIVGGINIDIRNRTAKSIDKHLLYVYNKNIEKIIELYYNYNCPITKFYCPPSIPLIENWKNYEFPYDFFYNPAFEVFETRINSGLMCLNFIHASLEIEPINKMIAPEQIKRVKEIEAGKYRMNDYLNDNFWKSYNSSKVDYRLPELTDKEQ
ncbi:MAG: hypothetical protein H7259_01250 [Cytophagales bacterium]|nr:hypothetical protein [Cytophaga sp.]